MRQGFAVFWEAMIGELRAVQIDLHARAKFTKAGDSVRETRTILAEYFRPAPTEEQRATTVVRSAARMTQAFDDGFVEVG